MDNFTPIEQLFPRWITARAIVSEMLPEVFGFEIDPHDKSKVWLSSNWASRLLDFTPEEDVDALVERLSLLAAAQASSIPKGRFNRFLFKPVNEQTLAAMNGELAQIDREWEAKGYPTLVQMAKHIIGIEAVPGFPLTHIKVTQTT